MRHASLFSGIDGFSLAAKWIGWKNLFTCEIDEFCNHVIESHDKKVIRYGDIKQTDFTVWRGRVDVLTGGFPCQPYSVAGKRLGKDDDRHLWPEMLRAIREISPRWVVGENVRGIINWNGGVVFEEVCSDLGALGYEVTPYVLPAAGVGAPHRRDRVWFVAHSSNTRVENVQQRGQDGVSRFAAASHSNIIRHKEARPKQPTTGITRDGIWEVAPDTHDTGAGVNLRVDGNGEEENQGRERLPLPELGQDGVNGVAAYSSSERLQDRERGGLLEDETENTAGLDDRFKRCGINGAFTHTDGHGFTGQEHREAKSRRVAEEIIPNDWQNFPTQPPVHPGDDGFSTGLLRQRIREDSLGLLSEKEIDQIISKAVIRLRAEAVKASGNAVVVPLVYQIFRAIQEYENSYISKAFLP